MKEFTYIIKDELGIHARPAGLLVKEIAKFKSDITLTVNGKSVDGKRLFAVMGLGAKCGSEVTVTCDGVDENSAAAAISAFFNANL